MTLLPVPWLDFSAFLRGIKSGSEIGRGGHGGVVLDQRFRPRALHGGYFVPISGLMLEAEDGRTDVEALRSVFHIGDPCPHGSDGFEPTDPVMIWPSCD